MSGIFGGSSANTDRGNQLAATQGDWNIFNYGMATGEKGQDQGQSDLASSRSTLSSAMDYWRKLMSAGRSDVAAMSAPAVNQALENETVRRNAEGTFGTDRTGGTVAANREAGSKTSDKIADIINSTLLSGRERGAEGLFSASKQQADIGSQELANSLRLMGLSESSINEILHNATQSRQTSYEINRQAQSDYGKAIGQVLLSLVGGGG